MEVEMSAPRITCLHPVQVVAGGGRFGKGVVVSLSPGEALLRTGLRLMPGDVVVLAGHFDGQTLRIAGVITESAEGLLHVRLAAMSVEARAALTRFVFSRMRKHIPLPPREVKPPREPVEALHRIEVTWVPSDHKADRHQDPSERWLDRKALAAKRRLSESVGS